MKGAERMSEHVSVQPGKVIALRPHEPQITLAQLADGSVMSEGRLLNKTILLARDLGLLQYHVPDSRAATSPGFPDLVLVGDGGVLYVELKRLDGVRSDWQVWWADALMKAEQEYQLWTEHDWHCGRIQRELYRLTQGRKAA